MRESFKDGFSESKYLPLYAFSPSEITIRFTSHEAAAELLGWRTMLSPLNLLTDRDRDLELFGVRSS